MRVLVCDDDPGARFVAKRWLTNALGCTVTESEDGVQALELLAAHPFDLVMIDLELPRLDGVEVVEAIRANELTADLPIVILSGERREEVVRTLVSMGVSAYLLKPLRERTVLGRIGPLISTRRASRPAPVREPADIRLALDTPALLVDGDELFRQTFAAATSQFGSVITAESGADALATFRRAPVDLVFIGTGLGILGAEVLVKKIRDVETSPTRIIGVGLAETSPLRAVVDGAIARTFLPETLAAELQPYVRAGGALAVLDALTPQFAGCLSSAVTQVFGTMAGLGATAVDDGQPDPGPPVMARVTVESIDRHRLELELILSRAAAEGVAMRLLGCDAAAVDEAGCITSAGEIVTMVGGRLESWLNEREVRSQCGPASGSVIEDGAAIEALDGSEGFGWRFHLTELGQDVAFRGRLRRTVEA